MHVRKQPIAQALVWARSAINLGIRNPRAIFGAALWLIASLYLLAVVVLQVALPEGASAPGSDIESSLGWIVLLFVIVMLLLPVLMGGLMHVIREAEAGRHVRATGIFSPFRQGKAVPLAMLGVAQLLFGLIGGVLVVALAGANYWQDYLAAIQSAMSGKVPTMPEPANPGAIMVLQLFFNYFSYAVMLFSIPLVLFSKLSVSAALRTGLRASLSNAAPNLLAAAIFFGGTVLTAVIVVLLAALATAIGGLIHPAVAVFLQVVVMTTFGAVVLVVLTGGAYFAWRDMFDEASPDEPVEGKPALTSIEA